MGGVDALTGRFRLPCPASGWSSVRLSSFREIERLDGSAHPALYRVVFACTCGGEHVALVAHDELDWSHREPSYLTLAMQGQPVQRIGRGDPFLLPEIVALGRTPRGHPEGLREAFANLYAEVAQERIARSLGTTVPSFPYPRIEDGAHTMAFIEACIASHAKRAWVDVARLPTP